MLNVTQLHLYDHDRLEVTLEKQFPLGDWPTLLTGPQQIPEGIPMANVQQVCNYKSIGRSTTVVILVKFVANLLPVNGAVNVTICGICITGLCILFRKIYHKNPTH